MTREWGSGCLGRWFHRESKAPQGWQEQGHAGAGKALEEAR